MQSTEQAHSGLVVASFGNRGMLESAAGETLRYVLKGRKLRAVCGDHVDWDQNRTGGDVRVTNVLERRNALNRLNSRGQTELMASNLDQIVVVLAASPAPDFFLVDRFLCAAELLDIAAYIVWNKTDMCADRPAELSEFAHMGYRILGTSTAANEGIDELRQCLAHGVGMLVGQSGVGKSSLINTLLPGAEVAIGPVSEATREGKHTTTASIMHKLAGGGRLIDSPGVREFLPAIDQNVRIQKGFREIVPRANDCRFSDCRHIREPNCAVKAAVASGEISARRYESYKRIYLNAESVAN